MITVENVAHKVAYGDEQLSILKPMSFCIEGGQTVAITGSSGSGKTTLLGLLAGLDVPTEGVITVEDRQISRLSEDERALFRGQYVGFVFQSFHLLQSLTALENVALPLDLRGDKQAQQKAQEYLRKVGLAHRLHHLPSQLSGGEQQRVAIARAFATHPRYLFADEPTGNLDAKTGAAIIELLFDLNAQYQTTLVMVTHEQRLASLCQRQLLIEDGELQEHGA
jgi:putative ABC transport system ATP-binding protein